MTHREYMYKQLTEFNDLERVEGFSNVVHDWAVENKRKIEYKYIRRWHREHIKRSKG